MFSVIELGVAADNVVVSVIYSLTNSFGFWAGLWDPRLRIQPATFRVGLRCTHVELDVSWSPWLLVIVDLGVWEKWRALEVRHARLPCYKSATLQS